MRPDELRRLCSDAHTPASRPLDVLARVCRRGAAGWALAELPTTGAALEAAAEQLRLGRAEFAPALLAMLDITATQPLRLASMAELAPAELSTALCALVRGVCAALLLDGAHAGEAAADDEAAGEVRDAALRALAALAEHSARAPPVLRLHAALLDGGALDALIDALHAATPGGASGDEVVEKLSLIHI